MCTCVCERVCVCKHVYQYAGLPSASAAYFEFTQYVSYLYFHHSPLYFLPTTSPSFSHRSALNFWATTEQELQAHFALQATMNTPGKSPRFVAEF